MDFEKARIKAFKRLKDDRRKAGKKLIDQIGNAIWDLDCYVQALRDLKIYPLWDAVAMWLDKDDGLAHYFPDDMERVAQLLLFGGKK